MSLIRPVALFAVVTSCTLLLGQSRESQPRRDPLLLDILTRVVSAAGGAQAIATVNDLTESGEITFYWSETEKENGPVVIRLLGGNHFRMEANLQQGKRTWVVHEGIGSIREENGKTSSISGQNAINLGNLTFPIGHVVAALADTKTTVSLVRIEQRDGRSVYRLRVKGDLGLLSRNSLANLVTKDLIIDAMTFDILSVEDHPLPTFAANGRPSDIPPREIVFRDFHVVDGIRVPFSITEQLHGQKILTIRLTDVAFNAHLSDRDFHD